MKKWLMDLVTEPDNKTICPVRIVALLGSVQYLITAGANYIQHSVFDAQNYAIGFGALLGGIGVALGLKKDTKADPK